MYRVLSEEENAWTQLDSGIYENNVYANPLIQTVYLYQQVCMMNLLSKQDVLIEVGSGTGKFYHSHHHQVSRVVGIDISEQFLKYARSKNPDSKKILLVQGDAVEMNSIFRSHPELQNNFWNKKRIVCCVLNTLGIMPFEIRQTVIQQMVKLMGNDGTFFLVVFNGDYFEQGINDFYRMMPECCGEIKNSDINLVTRELHVASSGYYTHWFSKEELIGLVENAGLKNYEIQQAGIAYFVTGSLSQR